MKKVNIIVVLIMLFLFVGCSGSASSDKSTIVMTNDDTEQIDDVEALQAKVAELEEALILARNAYNIEDEPIAEDVITTSAPTNYVIASERSHYIEEHDDRVYAIYEWENPDDNEDWLESLWSFSPFGIRKMIYEGINRTIDFRASYDNKYITVLSDETLLFYDEDANLINEFTYGDLNIEEGYSINLAGWSQSSEYFWLEVNDLYLLDYFIRIDSLEWEAETYTFTYDIDTLDYDFNPNIGLLAYSTYPVIFDEDSMDDYLIYDNYETLYIYNVITSSRQSVETQINNEFKPEWLDDNTLEYYVGSTDTYSVATD